MKMYESDYRALAIAQAKAMINELSMSPKAFDWDETIRFCGDRLLEIAQALNEPVETSNAAQR